MTCGTNHQNIDNVICKNGIYSAWTVLPFYPSTKKQASKVPYEKMQIV